MKKALVVGIDAYDTQPLAGCVSDAVSISALLEKNGDGSPNFSTISLTSDKDSVTSALLGAAIGDLFSGDADTALLYFAGHGIMSPDTNTGYLVSQDGGRGAWGTSLNDILGLANRAYPRIKSSVIILDSCHSGYAGEAAGLANDRIATIGTGVTILTASHRDGTAAEQMGRGVFTDILLDALSGGASDLIGRITPAAVYAHVDQILGAWEQRPIYKANVQTFITLRQVSPKIPLDALRRIPEYFPDAAYVFPLDPSYEPDRQNIPKELRHLPVNDEHTRIFKELQAFNRHGLVVPVDAEHMYYAAIESKGCRLTAIGSHYRNLAIARRL